MQAIQTRYHGPTNSRGSRVSARCDAGRVTIGWDDRLNIEENHAAAAAKLCARFGWTGEIVSGVLHDGSHVHVFVPREV